MASVYFDTFEFTPPVSCTVNSTPPTFSGITALTAQSSGALLAAWNAGTTASKNPIEYMIYIALGSVSAGALFVVGNLVDIVPSADLQKLVFTLSDQATYLVNGQTYTIGVRSKDSQGYVDTNTAIMTVVAIASGNIGGQFQSLYTTYLAAMGSILTAISGVPAAVWNSLKSSFTTSGTFGSALQANVDVNTSTLQTTATALTQYTNLQSVLDTLQTAAAATTQYNAIQTAIGLVQTAATALSQYSAIIAAVGTPQQAATALTQYNALQTAIGLTQTASTAATQYAALQTAIAAVQTAATALSQFNTLVSDIEAISSITPTQVAQAVWNAQTVDYDESGSFGANAQTPVINPTEVAEAVWNAQTSSYDEAGSFGETVQSGGINPTEVAAAVWNALTADYEETGSFGLAIGSSNIELILQVVYQILMMNGSNVSVSDNKVTVEVNDQNQLNVMIDC